MEELVPDWIKQIKNEDEIRNAISDAQKQRDAAGRAIIRAEGPAFWKQLLKELKVCVDGLEVLKLRGVLDIRGDVRAEQCCRVSVARKAIIPSQTYADLIYSQGAEHIRCYAPEGPLPFLDLCVYDDKVMTVCDDRLTPMDAEQACQFVVERMVRMVRS